VSSGDEVHQPEREWVVSVSDANAVAMLDKRTLAFGVVIDIDDEGAPDGDVEGSGATQIDIHALYQPRHIVARADDAVIGCGHCSRPVERVVVYPARVGLGQQWDGPVPVERALVVLCQLAATREGIALEVIFVRRDDTGLVEVLHGLAALVPGLRGR